MSDWAYVVIAYTAVWGSLVLYALVLTRRVVQARKVVRALEDATDAQEITACDAPPAR